MISQALIVEDHADTRAWLGGCLRTAFPGVEISLAATFSEGDKMLESRPQLALVDLNLPDGFGIDLVAKASRLRPPIRTIVTTVYNDDAHIFPALRAGASGYLLKDEPQEELVRQLLLLERDEPPLSPTVMRAVLKYFSDQSPALEEPGERLTSKERDVLVAVANGYTLDEIARSHGITRNTVATHVKRIYAKLKINNRAEAVQAAQRIGLLARS